MKILITGASSYVGARIYFDLKSSYDVIGTFYSNRLSNDFVKLDLTNADDTLKFVTELRPDLVVHVANFPNAKLYDGNESNYIALNYEATKTLVKASNSVYAKCIFISGQAARLTDNPYGKYKALSEQEVKKTVAGYQIMRPRLVLGISPNQENDRTFNRWLKMVKGSEKEITQDDTWKFQPTYIGHFSQIISQSISKNIWNLTVPIFIDTIQSEYSIASDVLRPFGIKVSPIAKRSPFPIFDDGKEIMEQFALDPITDIDFKKKLTKEIRNSEDYLLK